MSWSFNTGDRYHTQDTSYYCGAACAMMILNEIGVPYSSLDQDDLYTSNNSHNIQPGWSTDPYGLCFTLNDRRPTSFLPNFFVVHKRLTEAEGTRDVVFTLYHYKVSPAILVYNCAHWNVVCGVQTDVNPGSPYTVEGFWLNNPVWDSSISSHNGTDTCGSGGAHGVANEFVTYNEWQVNRFNGCAYDDPGGATQWISVCDPETPKIGLPRAQGRKYRDDVERRLLKEVEAVEAAHSGLQEYRLAKSKYGAKAFRQGKFGTPLLIQRLDRLNDYYYLVPWEQNNGIVGFADIDARFGFFKSSRVLSEPTREWLLGGRSTREQVDTIGSLIHDKAFEIPGDKGRFRVYPGTFCLSPMLVWKPCRESWSPHLPFYHLVFGANSLYVRIDGQVFTHLTSGRGV